MYDFISLRIFFVHYNEKGSFHYSVFSRHFYLRRMTLAYNNDGASYVETYSNTNLLLYDSPANFFASMNR
jgi:hypothetical protein